MECHFSLYVLLCVFHSLFVNVETQNRTGNNFFLSTISPEKYTLMIVPFLKNFTFWGKVSIDFSVINLTDYLILHSGDLNIHSFVLNGLDSTAILEPPFDETGAYWLVPTKRLLTEQNRVNITFTGKLNDIKLGEGFYFNNYINNETDEVYAATRTSMWGQHRLFPSLGNATLQAPVSVHIARFANQSSQSNMPLAHSSLPDTSLDGRVWDTFYECPGLAAHQVACSVHQLSRVANSSYTLLAASDLLDQTVEALSLLSAAVDTLQSWLLDLPLPLPKLDILALPDSSPRMTHSPGLVTCREDQVLYKEGVSNARSRQAVLQSVVNILAHQWLGRQVTPSWLSEGIATYLEYKLASQLELSWTIPELFCMEVLQEAFLEDLDTTHSSGNKPPISHKKVAAILRMTESITSEDVMRKGLQQFAAERGLVTPEKLFIALNQSADLSTSWKSQDNQPSDLVEFLQAWISQPGHPVVTVTINGSTVFISQNGSLPNNAVANTAVWPIQLVYTTLQDTQVNASLQHAWLTHGLELSISESSGWILLNVNQPGYYRVNYDLQGWQQLSDQLMSNHNVIPAASRSQLVDDVFQMARAGMLDYSVALNLSRYLHAETDLVVWLSAARNFEQLIRLFYGTPLASDLQRYVRWLYSPYYDTVHRMSGGDSHINKTESLDTLYWACHWSLLSCLNFTTALFKQWQSVATGFPPEYKPSALCAGVSQFPEQFMDVFDSFTQSLVATDRKVYLTALACSKNSTHLQYLMKVVFLDRHQRMMGHYEKLHLVTQLLRTPDNVLPIVTFLAYNYETAVSVVGNKTMDFIWNSIGRHSHLQTDVLLISELVQNLSLPLALRESLNASLATARKLQSQSKRLAPQVAIALQHVAFPSTSRGSSVRRYYFTELLVVFIMYIDAISTIIV